MQGKLDCLQEAGMKAAIEIPGSCKYRPACSWRGSVLPCGRLCSRNFICEVIIPLSTLPKVRAEITGNLDGH